MLRSPGLGRVLVRAFLLPVLVILGVGGYLVTAAALGVHTAPSSLDSVGPSAASDWEDGYSRRFPGCVASVLWPERETPVAIVVRWRSGEIDRVVMRHPSQEVFTRVPTGGADIIGACYRR